MRSNFLLTVSTLLLCSLAYASPKIWHGPVVDDEGQFPFVVAIYNAEENETSCTGTLVGDRWVLTAQHCVLEYSSSADANTVPTVRQPDAIQIGLGHLAALKNNAKRVINVKQIYLIGDRVDASLTRDVALLELMEPTHVTPVSLPQAHEITPAFKSSKKILTAVGFGFNDLKFPPECETAPDDKDKCQLTDVIYDHRLHFGSQTLQSDQDTINNISQLRKILPPEADEIVLQYNPDTMLGSMATMGNVITNGDSGGPLLMVVKSAQDKEPKFVQIGVNSWGEPTPGTYAAYKLMKQGVDVYALLSEPVTLDFIQSTIKKHA